MNALLVAASVAVAGPVKPSLSDRPALSAPSADPQHVRLIVVGDSGVVHGPEASQRKDLGGSSKMSQSEADALWATIGKEGADGIFVTGDLVYGPWFAESAPKCRTPTGKVKTDWLDPALGDKVRDLGVPVYLSLGNHDVAHRQRSRARERCLLRYAATEDALVFPQLQYTVDMGLVRLVVFDTNVKTGRWDADWVAGARDGDHWTLMGGHHVIRTTFDKESEHELRDWLVAHDLRPHLWMNGHAHFLQFGVYEGIPAVTSGAAAKIRMRPDCPGADCQVAHPPLYSKSTFGYTVVDATPDTLRVTLKDAAGAELFCWERTKADSAGGACAAE